MTIRFLFAFASLVLLAGVRADYDSIVLKDKPVAYWRLQESLGTYFKNSGSSKSSLSGVPVRGVKMGEEGPRTPEFPKFSKDTASALFKNGNYIKIKDPGEKSDLDFNLGDSITLEAWVNPRHHSANRFLYVIGKGRTNNKGVPANNHNYALRLKGSGKITFLFRNSDNTQWHRWTSTTGFSTESDWHYVAVSYTFGDGDSLSGFIDGKPVKGTWDMDGKSDNAPFVDNDELWLGSTQGGSASSGFDGNMSHIAIYRKTLSAKQVAERFAYKHQKRIIPIGKIPEGKVLAELIEDVPAGNKFSPGKGEVSASFHLDAFGLTRLPFAYDKRGIRTDRSQAMLLRLSSRVALPKGKHELLLRALNGSRLFVDGKQVVTTKFNNGNTSGHGTVPPIPSVLPDGLRYLRLGHDEKYFTWESDGKPHLFTHEIYVGGRNRKPDIGEASLSLLKETRYHLLAPVAAIEHSDEGWNDYAEALETQLDELDARTRRAAAAKQDDYWKRRHAQAIEFIASLKPIRLPGSYKNSKPIDRFIDAKIRKDRKKAAGRINDDAFLRRASIDLTGRIPSPETIRRFRVLPSDKRRTQIIDHLLEDPGWADNWVAYWQDVLAENPAILKPTLNNTGPFRFYIHEAFSDNRSMDRFASEMILMEGSIYGGGAGGFKLATQNDSPMADRAQIVSQAFLGQNLACARCHDSPVHEHTQQQTFQLAAMLNRGNLKVPATSSLPPDANPRAKRKIELSIKPGDSIKPGWAFPQFDRSDLSDGLLQNPKDSREQLAAHFTGPKNLQFARTIVNRVWKRYFGLGIVEPVDDWENAEASHPQLLDWLAREFVNNGYDLKWLAREITSSRAYQRQAIENEDEDDLLGTRWFTSPQRRRMTAEQLLDSLFAAVGKDLDSELLTLDNDYRRSISTFLNLGFPKRAWEFTTLSNDRDRPALSMPKTQAIIDLLKEFGWRETRQGARTVRDDSPNVLQPAALANGSVGNGRVSRLSDDCEITELCLTDQSLIQLVNDVFERILTRSPANDELLLFVKFLKPGYKQRLVKNPQRKAREYDKSLLLSWSNHLNAKSTDIKYEVEQKARLGDEPTPRLTKDWRGRMEDMVWACLNSPEFLFIP
ncbi:MAG: hypothetical protein CMO80_17190 [Verrucomicrobiales bacterium]|nr:hypothetical protein [Verrucomicrobiales bacterium]|tara:strand:- start:2117 stop:5452 length:3336 start_codon:yes stop_codon:yes gene_type:complete